MEFEGGCYCGAVRYKAEGDPLFRGECFCRECQYFSGGASNVTIGMPQGSVTLTKGAVQSFSRSDLDTPVAREFCGACGTQLFSKPAGMPAVLVKAGTFDNPADFGAPEMAIYTCDAQPFHTVPTAIPTFEKTPG